MKSVSVAMACYNGEKYLKEQVDSILSQLKEDDELVASIDPSTDATKEILEAYGDSRIHILSGPGKGVKKNFENAIKHCRNDIIFLSDQDDVWYPNKVEKVLDAFEEDIVLVEHDANIVNNAFQSIGPSFFELKKVDTGILHNMIRNGYIGCCMAFRKELVPLIVPIPENIYMHDQWIGMVGDFVGKNVLIQEPLLYYRRHGENVSEIHHGSIPSMIIKRIHVLEAYLDLRRRVKL